LRGGVQNGAVHATRPIGEALLSFYWSSLKLDLAGSFRASETRALGPGQVRVGLHALSVRGCFDVVSLARHTPSEQALRLFACTGLSGGLLSASARGFTSNFEETRPFLAVPGELALELPLLVSGDVVLGFEAGATAWMPLSRESFVVDGIGRANDPARVGLSGHGGLFGTLSF
jgi:hypothetical protein